MKDSIFAPDDIEICAAIQKKHATSYALATRLFPVAERTAVQVLYAFVRVADDLVDEPTERDPAKIEAAFEGWVEQWERAYNSGTSTKPVLRASAQLFHHYSIPKSYADAFLGAMRRDLHTERYATYQQLIDDYVYGSASVVGLAMCRICGVTDEPTLAHAKALGEAMQLTNFLRDISEDYRSRGRLYLAEEDLRATGVSIADIAATRVTPQFTQLLQLYISRARALYTQADIGIRALPTFAQKPVKLSRILYSRILDQIEKNQYDVFRHRARTNDAMKLLLLLKTLYFS